MRKLYFLVTTLLVVLCSFAQTPVPMASQPGLSYTESFADISNWTNGFAAGTGADRFSSVASNTTGVIPNGTKVTAATTSFTTGTTGGVQRGAGTIMLLSTGSTDNTSSTAIDFLMDFTGVSAGTLSFDWASVNNSTGDRKGSLRVYYSTDGTTFTELTSAQVLNFTNNTPTSGSISFVALPGSFSNSATARLRFYYHNGSGGTTGSRPKVSIDNLTVTAVGEGDVAAPVISSVSPANNAVNIATNLTATITFNEIIQKGSGNIYVKKGTDNSVVQTVDVSTTSLSRSQVTFPLSLSAGTNYYVEIDAGAFKDLSNNSFAGISGSSTWSFTTTATTFVSVSAGSLAAEPATNGSFIFSLSQPAPAGGVTINYALSGSATQNTDYSEPNGGSITITEGNSSAVLNTSVIDDTIYEGTETITITLNSVTNSEIGSGNAASINLLDNETPPPPTVVINQVYGGGGNSGALYTHDFIELYNYGNAPVPLDGLSLQYTSAGGSGNWIKNDLSGTVPAHSFFLIQEAKGNNGTKALPSPDATGTLAMSGSSGKVVLSNSTTVLTGANPEGSTIVDKVGYGSSATGYETAPAPGTDNATSVRRVIDGIDTDNNATDFVVGDPLPRNTSYTTTAPVIASLMPPSGYVDVASTTTPVITFDKPVQKGSGTITLLENGAAVATIDVTSTSVVLTDNFSAAIHTTLAPGKTYSIQISAGAFTDMYGNAFAGISNTTDWTFTTYNSDAAVRLPLAFDFNNCPGNGLLPQGFTRYSTSGVQQWDCSVYGNNTSNGVQMNGFDGETNIPNVDWLISPKIDLTGTAYPLLSFWSSTAFNGKPLQLKISTDYTGGDPALATWTDLNGKFPAETSNTWTESKDINLSRFKNSAHVHIAFVYTSSDEDGARWTLDDISLTNSETPPPPSLTVGTTDLQLGYAPKGGHSDKSFTFTGNDLVEEVTLTASAPFLLSKDGSSYSASLTYSVAEANDVEQTAWVRFAPTEKNKDFIGTVTVSTSTLSSEVALKGTSINPEGTLEVVNWNVEWFGSTEFGPTDEDKQEANIAKVLQNIGADIYGLGEVVSEERLKNVVSKMPGYAYVIGDFGSHTNPYATSPSPLSEAQKLAFVYKTSVIENLYTRPLLSVGIDTKEDLSNPQYSNWSSGRFPFLMKAKVTLNCVPHEVNFVMVHAKANTSPTATSYTRREAGAKALHDSLDILFPEANVVILGDFNDDLDISIMDGKTATSWSAFTTDGANYTALTLPLSEAGKRSTVSHDNVIDHVVVSNDMVPYYMEGTAAVVTDVTSMVSNYGSTTSDHYPVFTRYRFEEPAAPVFTKSPGAVTFCASTDNTYTIDKVEASASCGTTSYSYEITGATERTGHTEDASGAFNVGVSTITWTATDGLGNSTTYQTTVTVNANPVVTIADAYALPKGTKANTVYVGYSPAASLTLAATASDGTPGYTYNWNNGTSESSLTVSPTTQTEYSVTATDANGCTATDKQTVYIVDVRAGKNGDKVKVCHKGTRGTNNLEIEAGSVADHLAHGDQLGSCPTDGAQTRLGVLELVPDVQPNPSRGAFTIGFRGGDETKPVQLIVTDLAGRVLEKKEGLYTGDTFTLGSHYHSGIYLVTVLHNGERHTLKLVKQ